MKQTRRQSEEKDLDIRKCERIDDFKLDIGVRFYAKFYANKNAVFCK